MANANGDGPTWCQKPDAVAGVGTGFVPHLAPDRPLRTG